MSEISIHKSDMTDILEALGGIQKEIRLLKCAVLTLAHVQHVGPQAVLTREIDKDEVISAFQALAGEKKSD